MITYSHECSLELLRTGTGIPDAQFREGQEEAIRSIVEQPGRYLVVQKTGWGKSFVYFIATKLLREAGQGPVLLVSPLLALMRNQIAAAERMGVRAKTINSDNPDSWSGIEVAVQHDEVDILLISPERLANERFRSEVLAHIAAKISLLVVDEAHCISDWGHDFRPHYRLLQHTIEALPTNMRLLATTATANNRVIQDLQNVLGPNLNVSRGELNRPSLKLQTLRLASQAERLAWLAKQIPAMPGSGIVYTLTVRDAVQVAEWLTLCGVHAVAYTGDSGSDRPELEQALLDNRVQTLVATTALGMGFDKPDLGFVVHYQTPGSVVAYYQQVGRAGRALDAAYGILLSGTEENDINEYFIKTAFPTRDEVQQILRVLERSPQGLSLPGLMASVNVAKGRIEKTIDLLSLESPAPIVKQGTRWQLTATNLSEEFWQRAQRLTDLRHVEQGQMQEYVDLPAGHMAFLIAPSTGNPVIVVLLTCQTFLQLSTSSWYGKQLRFFAGPVSPSTPADNGHWIPCLSMASRVTFPASSRQNRGKHSAHGVMQAGVTWCAKANAKATTLQRIWSLRARQWFRNGTHNLRPPGSPAYRPCATRYSCRMLPNAWHSSWDCRFDP